MPIHTLYEHVDDMPLIWSLLQLSLHKAAKGGVLFIDEAYELGKGPFGQEACTRIVEAMTDPRYAGSLTARAQRHHAADGAFFGF